MKICEHCGHHNWDLVFVRVIKLNRKIALCDECGKPMLAIAEGPDVGGSSREYSGYRKGIRTQGHD